MIYTIAETLASIMDSVALIAFLTYALSFKNNNIITNFTISIIFAILFFVDTILLNHYFMLEGIYSISYIIILFGYCRISLNGKWWHQLLMIVVELSGIFLVNTIITILSSSILKENYTTIFLMRSPARLFMLFVSKISFISFLIPIAIGIKKQKILLQLLQTLILVFTLSITTIVGILVEEMILENNIPIKYASAIMVCLSVIDILLLFIFIQFSAYNQFKIKQVALQTRLHDDETKIKEALQWNKSIRRIQHDMNNHISLIAKYIEQENADKALTYIKKISENLNQYPIYTNTSNLTLNAMIDMKKSVCKQENISVKCYIQDDIPEFDDVTFCTIFGNLLDNAIEAEKKEQEKEIRLSIEMQGTYLRIIIQNFISTPILIHGKIPKTSKSDKINHGLGTDNIIDTVNQNNGFIEFYEQDNWFIVDVLLPI